MRHPLLLALCAGFSGCLSAEPLVWPPELLKLGSRFLVVTDSAGDRSVLVVDPSVSTLIPSDALGHLQLLGYPEPPEALGISISDGRVLLAKAGSTGADTKLLPPGAVGFDRAAEGWKPMEELVPFESLRLQAPPCPAPSQHSAPLGLDADVDVLLPYGPERVLVITRGISVHLATAGGVEPAPEILAALTRTSTSVGRVAGYPVGDDIWLVMQTTGDVVRLSLDGRLEKVAAPALGAHLELVGAAGGVTPTGAAEVFAFSSRYQHHQDPSYEPAELYHLAPGSSRWEATGFPDGSRDVSCPHEGGVGNAEMSYLGPGKVRFTYERGGIYTYDAATRTFSFEAISTPAQSYCRTAVDWSDPARPVAVLERTVSLDARTELFAREEGSWRRLGELPAGIAADLTIRYGGERYLPLRRGQIQLFRTYQDLQRRDVVASCPPILTAGGNVDRAAVNGRLVVVDGGHRGSETTVEVGVLAQ